MTLKLEMLPYLHLIYPPLLKLVEHNVEISVEGSQTSHAVEEILGPAAESTGEASKFSVNTFETEEKELGI